MKACPECGAACVDAVVCPSCGKDLSEYIALEMREKKREEIMKWQREMYEKMRQAKAAPPHARRKK